MKSIITALLLLAGSTSALQAQAPDWQINPGSFQYSMTVIATLDAPEYTLVSESDLVGVFAGDELRGYASPAVFISTLDSYAAFVTVFSNEPSGELMTFQMYDSNGGQLFRAAQAVTFEDGKQVGSIQAPMPVGTARLSVSPNPIGEKNETDEPFTITLTTNVSPELTQELVLEKKSGPIEVSAGESEGEFIVTILGAGQASLTALLRSSSLFDGTLEEIIFPIAEEEPEVLGLDDKSESLSIYPNPASAFLRVSLPTAQNARASIVGLDGRELVAFQLINGDANVGLGNLRAGLYVLLIQDVENGYFASRTFMIK